MKIRRNTKLSQFSIPSPSSNSNTLFKTHFNCQLNQSPWDIITFPPNSESYESPTYHFQVDKEFGFTGNGSFSSSGHSIGAVDSDGSVKASMENQKILNNVQELDFGEEGEITQVGFSKCVEEEKIIKSDEEQIVLCCVKDGKGWQCGRFVNKGDTVCSRHLKNDVSDVNNSTETRPVSRGRGRPRKNKKESAPTFAKGQKDQNPHEFYYYSGFGPLWGKNIGTRKTRGDASGIDHESATSLREKIEEKKRIRDQEIQFVECDDDDDDEEHEIGKKRVRKKIKARSLKSLM